MSDTRHLLQDTCNFLQQAIETDDALQQVLFRYQAHIAFVELRSDPSPAIREVYGPVLQVLGKPCHTYSKSQLQMVLDTLVFAVEDAAFSEVAAMELVDAMEDAGLPVNPPCAEALTAILNTFGAVRS